MCFAGVNEGRTTKGGERAKGRHESGTNVRVLEAFYILQDLSEDDAIEEPQVPITTVTWYQLFVHFRRNMLFETRPRRRLEVFPVKNHLERLVRWLEGQYWRATSGGKGVV